METHLDRVDFDTYESDCGTYRCMYGWYSKLRNNPDPASSYMLYHKGAKLNGVQMREDFNGLDDFDMSIDRYRKVPNMVALFGVAIGWKAGDLVYRKNLVCDKLIPAVEERIVSLES